MDARQEVKSLKKALRALTFLNQRGDSTVTEVATAIGIPRPTSYRILETLASEGYVEKQQHSGVYRITSMVQRLAAGFQDEELLLEVAKPMIRALGRDLGWPITLYTPRGSHMIVRINTDHDCALALERFNIGVAAPMLDATSGYCYLAHCSESEREELLALALRAGTQAVTVGDLDDRYLAINKHLSHLIRFNNKAYDEIAYLIDTVRNQGFCNIERKQYREGNVGVPCFLDGKPVGGIVMRYIKSVMKNTGRIQNFYVPKLQKLSQDIIDVYLARPENNRPVRSPKHSSQVAYPKFG